MLLVLVTEKYTLKGFARLHFVVFVTMQRHFKTIDVDLTLALVDDPMLDIAIVVYDCIILAA